MDQWAACLRRSLAPTTSRLDPGTQSQNSPRTPESRTGHPSACSLQLQDARCSLACPGDVRVSTTAEPNTELSIPGADAPLQKRSNPCPALGRTSAVNLGQASCSLLAADETCLVGDWFPAVSFRRRRQYDKRRGAPAAWSRGAGLGRIGQCARCTVVNLGPQPFAHTSIAICTRRGHSQNPRLALQCLLGNAISKVPIRKTLLFLLLICIIASNLLLFLFLLRFERLVPA